jgi:hypothetical protein
MRPNPFTRENLMTMPIVKLREIDIYEKEEEDLVQEVLQVKLVRAPRAVPIKNLHIPDIFNKEDEKIW